MNGDRTPCGTSTTGVNRSRTIGAQPTVVLLVAEASSFTLRGGFVTVAGTPAGTLPDRELGCLL